MADAAPSAAVCRRDRAYRAGLLVGDVVAAMLVVGLSTLWVETSHLAWTAFILPPLVPLVNAANGLYQRDARVLNKNTLDEAPSIFRATTTTTILAYLSSSLVLATPLGAKVVGFVWLSLTIAVPACRVLARAIVREVLPPERCLVLGDGDQARRLAAKLAEAAGLKTELAGVVGLSAVRHPHSTASPAPSFVETVRRLDVDRVLVVADASAFQHELEAVEAPKALGVKVSVLPRVLEVIGSSASYDYVDGLTMLGVPRVGIGRGAERLKRGFDVVGSAMALFLLAPALLVIAAAVKLTSPGPVFFRQTRIGRNGRPFTMLKFRSMRADADRLKDSLRDRNEQDGLFKIAEDPRMTRVGRTLRRSCLDELPQFINVLAGDMSLVGPRPLVSEEDAQIHGWHRRRLHLTPGMTGPWQVLGSSRIPLHEMVTIDYLYVTNWSLWNDVKILLRTVGTVASGRGR